MEEQWSDGEIWELAKCGSNVIVAWPTALINMSRSAEGIGLEQAFLFHFLSLLLFFQYRSFVFFVYVGGTDLAACKPVTKKWIKFYHHCVFVCPGVVLGCDCCLSDTDESHSVLFRRQTLGQGGLTSHHRGIWAFFLITSAFRVTYFFLRFPLLASGFINTLSSKMSGRRQTSEFISLVSNLDYAPPPQKKSTCLTGGFRVLAVRKADSSYHVRNSPAPSLPPPCCQHDASALGGMEALQH